MPEKKTIKKSFATLAADLRKVRDRKPTAQQVEELNSLFEEPQKKTRDTITLAQSAMFESSARGN